MNNEMKNHIIFFSGGKSSFTVAHLVKERFPNDNILLYFTDTLWEDEDLYRFIYEASDKLKLPMLTHSLGINPIQLMFKQTAVFNSRIGNCSRILKMGVASQFLKKGIVPEIEKWHNKQFLKQDIPLEREAEFFENTTLYFGIGWEELHREKAIKKNWQPFAVEMPLIEDVIDNEEILKLYGIRRPRLYDYGFSHNNCKGRCVKAGQGHWKNLAKQLPDLFQTTLAQEHYISLYVSTNHYIRASKYLPEHERIPEESQKIMLAELNDAYADYFNGKASKPKVYVHPSFTAVPYETDLLPIDYVFIFNANKKARRRFKRVRDLKKRCIKSTPGLKLIETRHMAPVKYTFMKKSFKGITHSYAIRDLAYDMMQEQQTHKKIVDDFDVGGCGCFVEYESSTEIENCEFSVCDIDLKENLLKKQELENKAVEPIKTLNIDIETYSSYDLKKVGVYKYCEAHDFEILIFAYSVDGKPTVTVELARGEEIPREIVEAILDPSVLKKAFNAQFERVAISQYFIRGNFYWAKGYEDAFTDLGYLNPKQWRCTMVDSMKAGLPATLKGAALALELDEQKDSAGTHLINFFSKPRKPTKNDKRTRNIPEDDLDKWNAFVEYCRQDVETEKAVGYAVDKYLNLGSKSDRFEMALYHLDQEINDRGVLLDMNVVDGALAIDEAYKTKLMEWGKKMTGLDNPNSPKQLMEWFKEQGLELPNLTKDTVKKFIDKTEGNIRSMLEIRQELAKTSTAKYVTMKAAVCSDGRVRGLLQFYGASRTGRWAGRLVQVQNLPQNKITDLHVAREIVENSDLLSLELLYDQVPFVLSQLIRTAFVAPECKTFAVSDFSAIEARVIAWIAGEKWRLEVFNTHGKIYEASAAQMFKVPIETIDKGSPLRQKGKVAELALGYQGGENALISMGALDMGIPQSELKPLVDAWRKANPKIKKLWWDIESAAMRAIENPGEVITFNKGVKFFMLHGSLMMQLPSGRRLCYYKAKLREHQKFEGKQEIVFWGVDGTSKAWCETSTYGGKLVENAVQAIARDCLAISMLRLDKDGYPIVMHIHDEAVMESESDMITTIEEIMGRPISWADGLPLDADGYETPFYKKD